MWFVNVVVGLWQIVSDNDGLRSHYPEGINLHNSPHNGKRTETNELNSDQTNQCILLFIIHYSLFII